MKKLAQDIEEYSKIMVVYEDDLEEDLNDSTKEEEA